MRYSLLNNSIAKANNYINFISYGANIANLAKTIDIKITPSNI